MATISDIVTIYVKRFEFIKKPLIDCTQLGVLKYTRKKRYIHIGV